MTEESYESTESYRENYKILLNLIARSDGMRRLLKIAQPENIRKIHEALANIEKGIARTEKIMELEREIFIETQKADKLTIELMEINENVEKELLEYVAKHSPEQLELLEAMLSDDDKTH